jgi:hypothetical protein
MAGRGRDMRRMGPIAEGSIFGNFKYGYSHHNMVLEF